MAGGCSGTSGKTKLSLAEVLAKLAESSDENESLVISLKVMKS